MKTFWQTIWVALSMYSRLPVPRAEWNSKNMRYALCALPLVGVFSGALLWLWDWLCRALEPGEMLLGAGVVLLPILVTGGIHMDGFCDTCDALASHGDREKKLAIMKDSNAGAFAVLGCACYLLFYFALASQWQTGGTWAFLMGLAMVLERALAGLSLCLMPCARNSGLARIFADGAAKKNTGIFLAFVAILSFCGLIFVGKMVGGLMGLAAFLLWLWYGAWAKKELGGITGDLQGYFVQLCEMGQLAVLVFATLAL